MLRTAEQTRGAAQLAVCLTNECGVNDDREAVLLMLTRFLPKYPSKKYQFNVFGQ